MPVIRRSATVPHPAESMFDLVADIDAYPEFVPGCGAARVLERDATSQVATVAVSRRVPGLKRAEFTTRNRLERPARIDMHLVDGPFRHLRGTWRFAPIDDVSCRAELEVDFEFASRLVGAALSPGFGRVCDSVVDAFVTRAATVLQGEDEAPL